jgi:hypothetical protein
MWIALRRCTKPTDVRKVLQHHSTGSWICYYPWSPRSLLMHIMNSTVGFKFIPNTGNCSTCWWLSSKLILPLSLYLFNVFVLPVPLQLHYRSRIVTTCHFVPKILTIKEWVHFFLPLCIAMTTSKRGWQVRTSILIRASHDWAVFRELTFAFASGLCILYKWSDWNTQQRVVWAE